MRENSTPSAEIAATGYERQKRWLYRWFYGHANAVICQSGHAMLNDLSTQFEVPREKMVRIYNPVDCERVRRLGAVAPILSAAGDRTWWRAEGWNRRKGLIS